MVNGYASPQCWPTCGGTRAARSYGPGGRTGAAREAYRRALALVITTHSGTTSGGASPR
jgi:hypothetical protein